MDFDAPDYFPHIAEFIHRRRSDVSLVLAWALDNAGEHLQEDEALLVFEYIFIESQWTGLVNVRSC